jgi:5-methylthioadenosine/S-adenosylhomocysteine deaminase
VETEASLLVSGNWVAIAADKVVPDSTVALAGNKILEVGPTDVLVDKYPAVRQCGGSNRLILPGLINTHTHLFQTFLKGLGQGMLLRPWIRHITTPAALAMNEQDAYLSAMVGLLEAVRSGTTSVFEYSYAFPDPALHNAILQAFQDLGIRGWVGLGLNDAGETFGVNPALIQPLDECAVRIERLHQAIKRRAPDRIKLALTPSSMRGLSREGLLYLSDYSRNHDVILSLHINETDHDNQAALSRFGMGAIPWLANEGILNSRFLAVHCVHMTDEDVRLLAQTGAAVSHNPVSNMYLGVGTAPVTKMLAKGVTVGLGSDGAASNNSQNMIETLKVTALAQRVIQGRPDVITANEAVALATEGGARALGQEQWLGVLKPGYQADLAVYRLDTARTVPVHDPLAAVVFSAGEANVETVIVGGQAIFENQQFTTVDEEKLLSEAQAAARAVVAKAKII